MAHTTQEVMELHGLPVYAEDGDKIGNVEDFYLDEATGQPEWIGIGTGIFRTKHVLVPVEGYRRRGDGIMVPFSKDRVKDAPDIDDDEISEDREGQLYEYYGLQSAGLRQPTEAFDPDRYRAAPGTSAEMRSGTPPADRAEMRDEDASLTRSEEEVRVGTRMAESGHARLRKWVETEPFSQDVTLRRETVHVEREPLDEPVTDAELGGREVDVTLMREEPVVEKRTVAKERVSLEKDVEERTERVTDDLARERIEVEGDTSADESERRPGHDYPGAGRGITEREIRGRRP